ncbi:MAG: lipid II flippase MurJ [Acidobacteriota bacterium]
MKWAGIFKETFYISSIHLSTKILGFLEKLLIAYVFGASEVSDAYFFSFSVFIIIFDFFNESTSPALLPEYVKSGTAKSRQNLFNSAFSYLFTIGLALSFLIFFFSPWIIDNFSNFPTVTADITISYLRIISLGIGFIIASISTYLFINSGQKFLPASMGDLMFKLTGSTLILYTFIDKNVGLLPLAVGIAIGSLMKLSTHIIYLRKKGIKPSLDFNPSMKKVLKLSAPMIIGILFAKFRIIFDNYLVSGMAVGSVTALQYGYRVMEFGIVVLLEPFSTVIFPEFVRLIDKTELFIEKISSGLKLLLTIFLPVSVLAYIFRLEIITILFGRGAFEQADIIITSAAFSYYALSMSFICIDLLLSRSLFALGDTTFPAIFEVISIVFHIIFALSFKSAGIHIISLSFLLNRVIKSILLYIRFRIRTGYHLRAGGYSLKVIFLLTLDIFFTGFLKDSLRIFENGGIITFALLSLIFASIYFTGIYLTGIYKEIIEMFLKSEDQT